MNRIKQLREERGESLEDLHIATKIPKSSLSEYEKGPRAPRKKEIWESLAKHFDVPVAYLMGVSEEKEDTTRYLKELAELIRSNNKENLEQQIGLFDEQEDRKKNYDWMVIDFLQSISFSNFGNKETGDALTSSTVKVFEAIRASLSNKTEISIVDLDVLFSAIYSIISRSISAETLYSRERSIEEHLEDMNQITNILNTLFLKSLDKKKFNSKESNSLE